MLIYLLNFLKSWVMRLNFSAVKKSAVSFILTENLNSKEETLHFLIIKKIDFIFCSNCFKFCLNSLLSFLKFKIYLGFFIYKVF